MIAIILPRAMGEGDRPKGGGTGYFVDSSTAIRMIASAVSSKCRIRSVAAVRMTVTPRSPSQASRSRIVARAVAHVVACSVDLDRESRRGAAEVDHIGPDRVLPSKDRFFQRARLQITPQPRFRRRQCAAQAARSCDGLGRRSHGRAPSTMLRMVPLPRVAGEDQLRFIALSRLVSKAAHRPGC